MEITIESMTGTLTRLTVNPLETVRGLKTRIWKQEGVPLSQQSLVFKDQELNDSFQLQAYNISDGSTVKLVLITRSGPLNFKSPQDDFSMSNILEFLRNVSMSDTSPEAIGRVGLVVGQEGSPINWYQFLDETKPFSENLNVENASAVSPSSNVCCELSPAKLESRRASAAKRAEENYRTMQRMRELRHSMERLNLEKARKRQLEEIPQCHDEPYNSRQRRSSGSLSAVNARMKSSKTFPISNAFIVSNAKNGPHLLSAAEDTSAKESSAGETEFEDCHHPVYNLPTAASHFEESENSQSINWNKANKPTNFDHIAMTPNENGSVACGKHVCSKREHSATKIKHIHISSSCSDLEPDSSVLVSSDCDAAPTSDQEHELQTADDGWSFDEIDPHNIGTCEEDNEGDQALYSSDYQDALGEDFAEFPILNSKSFTQFSNEKTLAETNVSDPSELSSGAIICDLAMNNRRSKVRRKYFNQRQFSKRPQQTSCRLPIDESEEQSSALEAGAALRFNGLQDVLNANSRPRAAVHQLRFGPRRARSKPRITATVPKTLSTGESSSDERDASCSDVLDKTRQSNSASKPTSSAGAAWKQKPPMGSRPITNSKKLIANTFMPSISSNAAYCGNSYSSSSSVTPVVRNHKLPQSSQSQQRCNICSCRLSLPTTFHCRCGKTVCPRHKNSESHSCSYNELRRDTISGVTADAGGRKNSAEHLPKL